MQKQPRRLKHRRAGARVSDSAIAAPVHDNRLLGRQRGAPPELAAGPARFSHAGAFGHKVSPIVVDRHRIYDARGWDFNLPHVHDVFEIGYCHKGKGTFKIGEKLLPFAAGDISIINQHEPHVAFYSTPSDWTWITVDPALLLLGFPVSRELLEFERFSGANFSNLLPSSALPELRDLIVLLIDEWGRNGAFSGELVRSYVMAIMGHLHRALDDKIARLPAMASAGVSPRDDIRRLGPALDQIQQRYRERMEIDDLARLVNMSPTNFRRVFKKAVGQSPHEYLSDYRLSIACTLLKDTSRSIEAAADESGFDDLSAFRRMFKKRMGVPAGIWRRSGKASAALS